MAKEGTELERVPLARDASYERQYSSQPSVAQIEVLDEEARPSTIGKNMPAINWGDKKVSPSDLEVCHFYPQTAVHERIISMEQPIESMLPAQDPAPYILQPCTSRNGRHIKMHWSHLNVTYISLQGVACSGELGRRP